MEMLVNVLCTFKKMKNLSLKQASTRIHDTEWHNPSGELTQFHTETNTTGVRCGLSEELMFLFLTVF